jgi:hypothetical protein
MYQPPVQQPQQPQQNQSSQQQPQQPQQNQQLNSIIVTRVPSLDYIKSSQVPAGIYMHDTLPYMFIKSISDSPIDPANIKIYKLIETSDVGDDLSDPHDDFVTRKEYYELKNSIASLEERMMSNESIYRGSKDNGYATNAGKPSDKPTENRYNKSKFNG